MKTLIAQIKDVVPKGIKVAVAIIFSIAVLCTAVFAFIAGVADAHVAHVGRPQAAVVSGVSLILGIVMSLWLLTMGYIYADSKRRGMPPALWLAVAILIPNMIGIILYFAMRKPLLSSCAQCGQGVTPGQRFCPSCGREQGTNSPSTPASSTGSVPLNRPSDGLAQKSFATGLSVWVVLFAAEGMFMYWKHATVEAGGWLILSGICALLVFLQQQSVRSETQIM